MFKFLTTVWGFTRPYRVRFLLGILMGILGGLLEPLMAATVVFVYGLIFPTALPPTSQLMMEDIKSPTTLIARLSHGSDPLSASLWNQFPEPDRQKLLNPSINQSNAAVILSQDLNHLVQCQSLYVHELFTGITLSEETLKLISDDPKGETLLRLNRRLLTEAYPGELARPSLASKGKASIFIPKAVIEWKNNAQDALAGDLKTHRWAAIAVIGLIPLVILLRNLFTYLNVYLLQWTAVRAITDLRIRLFGHLMHLSAGFFNRSSSGELMARTLNDTYTLQGIISNAVPVMVKDPVTLIGLLVFVLIKEPGLSLISIIIMPLFMVPVLIYNRKVRRSARALQTHVAELSGVMSEAFTGFRVVKSYNLEDTMVLRFRKTAAQFIGHYMRIVRSSEIPGPLMELVGAIGISMILIYQFTIAAARPSGEDFLAVILTIFMMYRPLKNLARLYNNVEQARAASERVFELLATENDIPEPANPKPIHAAGASIHFDDVNFFYGDKQVLQKVQLTVKPGQFVALVGSSGSGKTTLANLLLRFYDPKDGAIRIGNTDIREGSTQNLRDQIAVVTQDTILFNETVYQNIELGRPGASREDILNAAKHAFAYDFIMEKEGGFDFVVGEKGGSLSGGQKQRIAIARAILRDAPILILDEATSALDTESEHSVQAALEKLMAGRTTLCIAHRLSTIQKADLIVVLDQGCVVETGTHTELIAHDGTYRRLHDLSSGKGGPFDTSTPTTGV